MAQASGAQRRLANAPAVVRVGIGELWRLREALLDEAPAEPVLRDLDHLIDRARESAWPL